MPTSAETWEKRQAAIRELIAREAIGSQARLVERLARRGFEVTQSSVSRDLQEMGIVKAAGRYVTADLVAAPKAAPGAAKDALLAEAKASIRKVAPAGPYLLVVSTPAGLASSVAVAIDQAGWAEVVGTVAGDDTVFLATAGRRAQAGVQLRLERLTRER